MEEVNDDNIIATSTLGSVFMQVAQLSFCVKNYKFLAKKKQIRFVCLLLNANEKDIIGKHELAIYNGTLMEPCGSQHPGEE